MSSDTGKVLTWPWGWSEKAEKAFAPPKPTPLPPPPATPDISDMGAARRSELRRLQRQKGRRATILSQNVEPANIQRKTLLGQ